jgi:hypothetical protein
MAELPLDHDQRHAFACHLDGVGVAQLVRREAAPNPGRGSRAAQLRACRSGRPVAAARRAGDNAKQGADGKLGPQLQPGPEFFPSPRVHADLAAAPALAAPNQERAAALIEIALSQGERLVDPQPCSPQEHDQRAEAAAVRTIACGAHDGDDLLHLGRIGRIPQPLVVRRTPGVESRHRRRRTTSAGAIEQQLGHDPS